MATNEQTNNNNNPPNAIPNFFTEKDNMISIYTAMRILRKMKGQLGLEAMQEYLDHYIRVVDKNNPKLSFAVTKALSYICVEKMYKDASYGKIPE